MTEIGIGNDGVVEQHHERQERAGAIERGVARLGLGRCPDVRRYSRLGDRRHVRPGRVNRHDVAATDLIQQGHFSAISR